MECRSRSELDELINYFMKIIFIVLYLMGMFSTSSYSQDFRGRIVIGKKYADQEVKKAITNKNAKPFYDTLINNKEMAIAVVEPILFKIYGNENIIKQRPYESYLINGYWYISGTLPEDWKGGVFEIIISSKNAQVVKLIHGK